MRNICISRGFTVFEFLRFFMPIKPINPVRNDAKEPSKRHLQRPRRRKQKRDGIEKKTEVIDRAYDFYFLVFDGFSEKN